MRAVFWKELADHFGRRRFGLLFGLVVVGVLWGALVDTEAILDASRTSGTAGFFFLDVVTTTSGVPISLLSFLGFFGPIIGIVLGFDSINSERTQGTLSRVLSQPLFRDAVFNGKFLAGLLTLSILLASTVMVLTGVAMFQLGMAPRGEEVIRLVGFGLVAIAYLAFWLAVAMTASVFLRNTVASALVSIGVWIGSSFFIVLAASTLAERLVPDIETAEDSLRRFNVELWVGRASPAQLFTEATGILLDPIEGRVLTPLTLTAERVQGLLATPVSAAQSLQLVWPHIVVLVAMVAILLGLSYFKFMREEIRA